MDTVNILISIVALIIAVISWQKSRVIYEVIKQEDKMDGEEKIRNLLATGKYTVLHVQTHPSNSFSSIYILGKVRK